MATLEAKLDPARLELAVKAYNQCSGLHIDCIRAAILAYLSGPERAAAEMLVAHEWIAAQPAHITLDALCDFNIEARLRSAAAIAAAQEQKP